MVKRELGPERLIAACHPVLVEDGHRYAAHVVVEFEIVNRVALRANVRSSCREGPPAVVIVFRHIAAGRGR